MKIKPWRKIGSPELLAQSNGRRLVWQKFEDPRAKEIQTYTLFEAEKFSSIALPLTKDSQVLAVKQFRHGLEDITIELPSGNCDGQEQSPEAIARLEVAQETGGYEPEKIIPLSPEGFNLEPCYSHIWSYLFLFLDCQKTNLEAKLDHGEYVELIKIPLSKWLEMVQEGKVDDPKSIITTILALKHLGYSIQKVL